MITFTYDIPKNRMTIKTDSDDVKKNTKHIIRTVTVCATALLGFNLYLEYKKYLIQ